MELTYIVGDAVYPDNIPGNKIIVHVCNNQGGWGAGFVLAISARWKEPEEKYRDWFQSKNNFGLGFCQLVKVENDIWVGNMIAQNGYKTINNPIPLKYDSLELCLSKIADKAIQKKASIHMPRIGSKLAGGDWKKIEDIINRTLSEKGLAVFVYDLPVTE